MESTPEKLGLIEKYFSDFTPKQTAQFAGLEELYKDEQQDQCGVPQRHRKYLFTPCTPFFKHCCNG